MIEISMRQWTVLTFIDTYWRQHGVTPSRREIAAACGIASANTANLIIRDLEAAGVVRVGEAKSNRTVTLCDVEVGVTP